MIGWSRKNTTFHRKSAARICSTVAGGSGDEFTPEACRMIADATEGVPRLVNQLADIAMVYAWTQESRSITDETVSLVFSEGLFLGSAHETAQ